MRKIYNLIKFPLSTLTRYRWILGIILTILAGSIRHYFTWLLPLNEIEAYLNTSFPWARIHLFKEYLYPYHLLFTIPIFMIISLLTMPITKAPIWLLILHYLAWSATLFSLEDLSWYLFWMTKGGRWIQPKDWTCKLIGYITIGITIPNHYILSPLLLLTTYIAHHHIVKISPREYTHPNR